MNKDKFKNSVVILKKNFKAKLYVRTLLKI